MRQVVLIAPGSLGDVQPGVALGRGLRLGGDRVRVVAAERFRSLVSAHGLDFAPLSIDPGEILGSAAGRLWTSGRNPVIFLRGLRAVLRPAIERLLGEVLTGAAGADLVLAPTLGFLGEHLGEFLGVPDVQLHFQPSVPTREFPHPLLSRMPRPGRKLSFELVDQLAWQVLRPEVDRWRVESLGLPRAGLRGPRRRAPVLCGFGESVVPRPADWPERVHLTGYWYLEPAAGWQPDPVLAGFLDSGPPPVYLGFGSMQEAQASRVADVVHAAVRLAGCRAVLGGLPDPGDGDDLLSVRDVPHEWLFPRMTAAVHHGGAGTTGASLRAGLPTLVCPVFSDQPYWGDRVWRLGAGPRPLPARDLTVAALADRLRELVGSPAYRHRARRLGERLRTENGVDRACTVLREAH